MQEIQEGLTYREAHGKIYQEQGRAADYPCHECGAAARYWAYQYTDPHPKFDECQRPYSEDPSHYEPLCSRCHRVFDLKNDPRVREAARAVGQWRGLENKKRLAEDEEYRLRKQADSRAAVKKVQSQRRQCNDCGMISTPFGLGSHLSRKGHSGYTELKG